MGIIQWDPITREENSWLLDLLREIWWQRREGSPKIRALLQDEKDEKMFNIVYNKLAHEEWRFEHEQDAAKG